ncbi:MAG: hypothetical protein V8S76_00710 [Lachnospiraceae bacterium]
MKTYKEIIEEIKNVGLELSAADKEETRLVNRWADIPDLREKYQTKKGC